MGSRNGSPSAGSSNLVGPLAPGAAASGSRCVEERLNRAWAEALYAPGSPNRLRNIVSSFDLMSSARLSSPGIRFASKYPTSSSIRCGLHTLLLCGNRLERLPDLPPGVRTLHADRNRLPAIDTLPEGVRRLFVTRNALRTLKLPKDLQVLHADDNVLERLRVPRGLVMLSVPRNRLSALPEDVSETLAFIDAEDNDIHVLPQEAMSRVSPRCEILLAGNPLSSTTKAQLAQTMADARHHGPWISFS
jgi:Leucine-rich repeat (LRR) protein